MKWNAVYLGNYIQNYSVKINYWYKVAILLVIEISNNRLTLNNNKII